MNIPDKAVEVAAKALYGKAPRRHSWANTSEDYKEGYRHYAKVALTAAVPHLATRHAKTDPACAHYKETGPFRRYLNERGRGLSCHACVPPKDEVK